LQGLRALGIAASRQPAATHVPSCGQEACVMSGAGDEEEQQKQLSLRWETKEHWPDLRKEFGVSKSGARNDPIARHRRRLGDLLTPLAALQRAETLPESPLHLSQDRGGRRLSGRSGFNPSRQGKTGSTRLAKCHEGNACAGGKKELHNQRGAAARHAHA